LVPTSSARDCLLLRSPNKSDGRGYYAVGLESALNRIRRGDRQIHWIHQMIVRSGLKHGFANQRFSEVLMGFPPDWSNVNLADMGTPSCPK
jgi:hypothetical protein